MSFTLPPPPELGFPDKFENWHPDQLRALDSILNNPKRVTALAMPTGGGKSLTGVAAMWLHPDVKRGVYLTGTKGLQDQNERDFPDQLFDLRGAQNYPCYLLEPRAPLRGFIHGCDEGPCKGGEFCNKAPDPKHPEERPVCEYYRRVWDARHTSYVSTNYAMFFASREYGAGLNPFDMMVLDEAHDIAGELESFLTIELTNYDIRTLDRGRRRERHSMASWKSWAQSIKGPLESLLRRLTAENGDIQLRMHLKEMKTKIARLSELNPEEWVLDESSQYKLVFSPITVKGYAESCLFHGARHIVLMSATLTHKTLSDLGIAREDYAFAETPSRFRLEHRPIVVINTTPTVRVDSRMDDSGKLFWMRRIDRLIEPRREIHWKGIIHTVSYDRAADVIARSEHKDIMLTHDSRTTRDAVQRFKDMPGPAVLVSPAIMTGYDFADDECRYQILAKVPIPDGRSVLMKARMAADPEYSGYVAMQKLVQACGRAVRNPWDWAETFIVDDHFVWFVRKYRKHAPRWFLDAVEYVEYFPEPLSLF